MFALVSIVAAKPSSYGSSSSNQTPPAATTENGVKKVHDRNIDRGGNVVATLQHVNGTNNLNQKMNNQADNDMFDNNVSQGYAPLNTEAKADNVVAGLQSAQGTNTVDQGKNNNNDINKVNNTITSQNANSAVYFAAGNTDGKAIDVSSGTNMIQQVQNNDAAKNSFQNM